MTGYLPARILQIVGLAMLVSAAVFWGFTGRESLLLVSSSMSLILIGAYKGAIDTLRRPSDPPTPRTPPKRKQP